MEKKQVLKELRRLVEERAGSTMPGDEESFAQAAITEVMHMDSLEIVRFVVILEQHFNVELPDQAVINVVSFDDLAKAICAAPSLNAAV